MRIGDSAMDHMNRMATDILECEKCESENLEMVDADSVTFEFKCEDCGHAFKYCE